MVGSQLLVTSQRTCVRKFSLMLSRFCSEKFSLYIVFKSTLGLTAFLSHSLHRQNKEDVDFLRKNFWTQDLLFSSLQRTELGRGKEWKEVGLFFFSLH